MKHAGLRALDALEPLLDEVRRRPGLIERKRGVFYRKGKAWLHFHEDPKGLFADLKDGSDWTRIEVTGAEGQAALLRQLDRQAAG